MEATFTSLGLQSPAPRAALPAEPAAAEKRDASAQLTSCVLPSRATDVRTRPRLNVTHH